MICDGDDFGTLANNLWFINLFTSSLSFQRRRRRIPTQVRRQGYRIGGEAWEWDLIASTGHLAFWS